MTKSIYVTLSEAFNTGRQRAILCGGQAVVLHRVALMSKDGDWILREDGECLTHILAVLDAYGARYRFGAPLDISWMSAGWSAHFEFNCAGMRIRTDFVTRPPRLSSARLADIWREQADTPLPFLDIEDLIETKKTNREKDYVVIGELARRITDVKDLFRYARSARDLVALGCDYPDEAVAIAEERPALTAITEGVDAMEAALDIERRQSIRANEARLMQYLKAAERWKRKWVNISAALNDKPLREAHEIMVECAHGMLPTDVLGTLS